MVYCLRPPLLVLTLVTMVAMTMACVASAGELQQGMRPDMQQSTRQSMDQDDGQSSPLASMRESLAQYSETEEVGLAEEEAADSSSAHWKSVYSCLEQLPQEQKVKASAIVSDSLPRLQELDGQIHSKVDELQALTYSDDADPQALPKLGLDLQRLRNELRATLAAVNLRLLQEAGVQLQKPSGRGCQSMRVYDAHNAAHHEPAVQSR